MRVGGVGEYSTKFQQIEVGVGRNQKASGEDEESGAIILLLTSQGHACTLVCFRSYDLQDILVCAGCEQEDRRTSVTKDHTCCQAH